MATIQNYYKVKHGLEFPGQDTIQVTDSSRPNIRPSLNLDFAKSKVLDPRITFTRASAATYYDGKTVAKAEENLLLWSQEFDNASWVKVNSTVTANAISAPDGTTTADKVIPDTSTNNHYVRQSLLSSVPIGSTVTISVFAKADGYNFFTIVADNNQSRRCFDLVNGTVGATGGITNTASIVSAGSGWYRCVFTFTTTNTFQLFEMDG